jgi:aldehyde dehydrogenase (NAD+)
MKEQLSAMRQFYLVGNTRSYAFRKQQLQRLKTAVLHFEKELHEALYADLKKSPEESWVTETGFLIADINQTIKHLKKWMHTERVKTNLLNFP